MSYPPPQLEDQLERLAAGVAAPPTPDARQAIQRRTGVLRRRRRVGAAAGTGLLALAAIGGIALARPDPSPEAETAGTAPLPAFTLEVPGWDVVVAEDGLATGTSAAAAGSEQVFALPDGSDSPRLVVRHFPSSDAFGPPASGEEVVEVGAVEGRVTHPGPDELVLRWSPPLGDNTAEIEARGLTQEAVVEFAERLTPKDVDGAFQYPPSPDDTFGFEAGDVPEGMQEVRADEVTDVTGGAETGRRLVAESDTATAELTVAPVDDQARQDAVAAMAQAGPAEEVTVLGGPASLIARPGGTAWYVIWEPGDAASVVLDVTGADRATVDALLAGIRDVTEGEWDDLVASRAAP